MSENNNQLLNDIIKMKEEAKKGKALSPINRFQWAGEILEAKKENLPIEPPCIACKNWNPRFIIESLYLCLNCCDSEEQYQDFSCFDKRQDVQAVNKQVDPIERIQLIFTALVNNNLTVSISYGQQDIGVVYSVTVKNDKTGDEFDKPYAAKSLSHVAEVALIESAKRGWI